MARRKRQRATAPASHGSAGFTLIEMLIALVLFALISLAGLGLVDSILGAQSRTQGRLDRLGDIQRTMFLVTRDFEQVANAPIVASGASVALARAGPRGDVAVRYGLSGGALQRIVASGDAPHAQRLLDHVTGLRWQFFRSPSGWVPGWPPAGVAPSLRPTAVAMDVTMAPVDGVPGGSVRRVVALPMQP